jgi:O-antigen/teichoic acid export membrane protein
MIGVKHRLRAVRSILMPGSAEKPKSRSHQRYFRILLTASSAAAAKAVSVLVQLAMVPLMLSYLGDSRYGLWLTLQAVIGFGGFADLGIGNGAMNAISAANAKNDFDRVARIVASALAMLTALAIAGLIVVTVAMRYVIPGAAGLAGTVELSADAAGGIAVFAAYFALSLPLGFIERVNAAHQEGAITNASRSIVALITLLTTVGATLLHGSFAMLCIATLAPQLLVWASVWFVEFRRRPSLVPRFGMMDVDLAKGLLGVGVLFLGIQVLAAFVFSMDTLLISWINGFESVAAYGVQSRVFSLLGTVIAMALTPLWPAYADAVAHGDHDWVRNTLRRSIVGSAALATPLSLIVAFALPTVLQVWTSGRIQTTPLLAYGLAAATISQSICAALAMFWNGTSSIRLQFLMGLALVAASLPVKIFILKQYGMEPIGAVTALLTVAVVLIPAWFLVRKSLPQSHPRNA